MANWRFGVGKRFMGTSETSPAREVSIVLGTSYSDDARRLQLDVVPLAKVLADAFHVECEALKVGGDHRDDFRSCRSGRRCS